MKKYLGILLLLTLNMSSIAQRNKYGQVEMLLQSRKAANALTLLDSIGKSEGNSSTSLFQYYKVRCLSSLNRNEEALKICTDEIMRANNKDTILHEFYSLRSSIYMYTGKIDLAIQDINNAIALKPSEVYYYLNASYLYGETEDYENALVALDNAIQLNPKDVSILNNISYYSSMAKHHDKAITFANEGLKYTNDSMWVGSLLSNRGFANLGLGRYETALRDINESIKYNPKNSYAYYNKALTYIKLKEFGNACENLNLAKEFGGLHLTRDLIKQYCEK